MKGYVAPLVSQFAQTSWQQPQTQQPTPIQPENPERGATWGRDARGRPQLISRGTGFTPGIMTRSGVRDPRPPGSPNPRPINPSPTPPTPSPVPPVPGPGGDGSGGENNEPPANNTSPKWPTKPGDIPNYQPGTQPESYWPEKPDNFLDKWVNPAKYTQQTKEDGTTVGGYGDKGASFWGGNGFYATAEEAAANLDYLDKVKGTNLGEGLKGILGYASQHGIRPDADKWNEKLTGRFNKSANQLIDAATGLPFGITSTLVNPTMKKTPWGDDFNTGGGGIIGVGGNISHKNLVDKYYRDTGGLDHTGVAPDEEASKKYSISLSDGKYNYRGKSYDSFDKAAEAQKKDQDSTNFYTKDDLGGIGTPIATHSGFIPGTSVVSGNTDLAIRNNPALDVNGDGVLHANEIQMAEEARKQIAAREEANQRLAAEKKREEAAKAAAVKRQQEADAARKAEEAAARRAAEARDAADKEAARQEQLRQADLRKKAEEQRKIAEDARKAAEKRRIQDQIRQAEAEAKRKAELSRRQREAERKAEEQRKIAENKRRAAEELARRNREREENNQPPQRGNPVTDSKGNPVRDSSGGIVTDRPTDPGGGGGGGGGGGNDCFAPGTLVMMANGLSKKIEDVQLGDEMELGGRVYGLLQGLRTSTSWLDYNNTIVTPSHFVYEDDKWVEVGISKNAKETVLVEDKWYCVLNENHKVVAPDGTIFTDFDAVDSVNEDISNQLNGEANA